MNYQYETLEGDQTRASCSTCCGEGSIRIPQPGDFVKQVPPAPGMPFPESVGIVLQATPEHGIAVLWSGQVTESDHRNGHGDPVHIEMTFGHRPSSLSIIPEPEYSWVGLERGIYNEESNLAGRCSEYGEPLGPRQAWAQENKVSLQGGE